MMPPELETLHPFVDAGVLEDVDVQVAAALARTVADVENEVILAAALCVRAIRLGNICVELDRVASDVIVEDGDVTSLPWPEPGEWARIVRNSTVVGTGMSGTNGTVLPLVYDLDRLYLERYWRYERDVANHLSVSDTDPSAAHDHDAVLDGLFGSGAPNGVDLQRHAVSVALTSHFAVIAGGPGTGKTWTVSRLLAAVEELDRQAGRSTEVALVAPTGKAAKRMTEAVGTTEATTIHRLLGRRDGVSFFHRADNPLPHDLVIVDEASMVDLPLMAKLVCALKPQAHLVLVGDPHQLASVEAGAVLGDIVDARVSDIVVLERRHRFGADSAIAALADAVRNGDVEGALSIFEDADETEVRRIDPADSTALDALRDDLGAHAREVVDAARRRDVAGGLVLAGQQKVLCATRFGPLGLHAWSQAIEQRLDHATRFGHYVGKPVIATRNDYVVKVMNGDSGIITQHDGHFTLAMDGPDGIRVIPAVQLDHLETWWAMTIHKSQGSEFDHAIVSLPTGESPALTRELLYTGITRGKRRVTVVADKPALRRAIEQPIRRASGLRDRLALIGRGGVA